MDETELEWRRERLLELSRRPEFGDLATLGRALGAMNRETILKRQAEADPGPSWAP